MMDLTVAALCGLLFLLVFACLFTGIGAVWDRISRKRRLTSGRSGGWGAAAERMAAGAAGPYGHLADLLETVRWRMSPGTFASVSLFLSGAGMSGGLVLFQSFRSAGMLSLLAGGMPYLILRMRLVSRQMATRLEFLPAVELFYQCYLVTGSRHVRSALQKTIEERRLPGEVHAVFEQLCRHLAVRGDDEENLRRFSLAFGHVWADYFGSILKIALSEGHNVADNLKELIADMRKAQLANQRERHRLLEIRLANFTPVLFLAMFLGINFRMNPEGSRLYYVLDPTGRGMLLNALVLIFGSMLMGIYLSRKRM